MKKLFTPFLLFAALTSAAQVSHTVVLRPGPSTGKNASLWMEPNLANINDENLIANAWTAGGGGVTQRTLFDFSLPTLPANATLVNATLTLYGNVTTTHPQKHSSYEGSPHTTTNECLIQRVTTPWSLATVSWSNQPSVTVSNEISLAKSTTQSQNYVIDATQMVKDMLDTPDKAYGFMLRLQNEAKFRTMIFGSSMHTDSNYRPKLEITYTTPSPSAVATVAANAEVTVYPNPVLQTLNIGISSNRTRSIEVILADATGRIAVRENKQIASTGQVSIDVAALPRGLYFLKVTQADGSTNSQTVSLR